MGDNTREVPTCKLQMNSYLFDPLFDPKFFNGSETKIQG